MPGRLHVDAAALLGLHRPLAVDGVAQRVDHAAEQPLAHGHIHDGAGALDRVALADGAVVAEDDDADIVGFEIERHAADAAGKFDGLARLDAVEAPYGGRCRPPPRAPGPTSATSACEPKSAIWRLRISEISAARISIMPLLSWPLRAPRRRPRTEASTIREPMRTTNPPISDASVVARIRASPPTAPETARAMASARPASSGPRRNDFRLHLATMAGKKRVERADRLRHREQAAVARQHAEEARDRCAELRPPRQRRYRRPLLGAGDQRAPRHKAQVGAGVEHFTNAGRGRAPLRRACRPQARDRTTPSRNGPRGLKRRFALAPRDHLSRTGMRAAGPHAAAAPADGARLLPQPAPPLQTPVATNAGNRFRSSRNAPARLPPGLRGAECTRRDRDPKVRQPGIRFLPLPLPSVRGNRGGAESRPVAPTASGRRLIWRQASRDAGEGGRGAPVSTGAPRGRSKRWPQKACCRASSVAIVPSMGYRPSHRQGGRNRHRADRNPDIRAHHARDRDARSACRQVHRLRRRGPGRPLPGPPILNLHPRTTYCGGGLRQQPVRNGLFHGDRLGQIARLVDGRRAFQHGDVIGQQLHRKRVENRRR